MKISAGIRSAFCATVGALNLRDKKGAEKNWTASEIALNMHIIVDKICQFLDVPSLKTVRRLNHLWRDTACKHLLVKSVVQVPPSFYRKRRNYFALKQRPSKFDPQLNRIFHFIHGMHVKKRHNNSRHNNDRTLVQCPGPGPKITAQWSGLRSRHVPNIKIRRFEDVEILKNLQILGANVQTLQFPYQQDLFDSAPNAAESDEGFERMYSILKELLSVRLTSLKTFHYFEEASEFGHLTHSLAPYDLPLFIQSSKVPLVRDMTFDFSPDYFTNYEITNLEAFANGGPKLTSLTIKGQQVKFLENEDPILFQRFVKVFNKILESSKETLKKMTFLNSFGDVRGIEIPELPFLTELIVLLPSQDRCRIPVFPKKYSLSSNFDVLPRLENIVIGYLDHIWRFLTSFEAPSKGSLNILLPFLKLKPTMKLSHYDFINTESFCRFPEQILVCPANFIPDKSTVRTMRHVKVDDGNLSLELVIGSVIIGGFSLFFIMELFLTFLPNLFFQMMIM